MSAPVANSMMSVICLIFCQIPISHNQFKTSLPTSGFKLHYQSGPKSIIATCRVLWSELNFANSSFHNNLKQVLCLSFLPEFQNVNSLDSIFLSCLFWEEPLYGEKNVFFECPLYSLPQDCSSFVDISQTESNSVLQRKRLVSSPGARQLPTVLFLRVGIIEPKCQGAALFSVDILNSDCLLPFFLAWAVFVPPVMIWLQKIQWLNLRKSSKF